MNIARRIAQARYEAGYGTAEEFASVVGKSVHTIRQYEAGGIVPPTKVLEKIAEITKKRMAWFFGETEESDLQAALDHVQRQLDEIRRRPEGALREAPEAFSAPLLGTVPAGRWAEAIEYAEDTVPLPPQLLPDRLAAECFLLRVRGKSMILASIRDGDMVLVERIQQVTAGDIAVIQHEGDVVLRWVYNCQRGHPVLVPAHPNLVPEPTPADAHVLGRVRAVYRTY